MQIQIFLDLEEEKENTLNKNIYWWKRSNRSPSKMSESCK